MTQKIAVCGSEFNRAVKRVTKITKAVGQFNTMLKEVLLTANAETKELHLYATDLNMFYEIRIGMDFVGADLPEGWAIVVEGRKLAEIAGLFAKLNTVYLYPDKIDSGFWLHVDGVLTERGNISSHKLVALSPEEFPPRPLFGVELVADRQKQIEKLQSMLSEPFEFKAPDKTNCEREYQQARTDPVMGLEQKAETLRARLIYWRGLDGQEGAVDACEKELVEVEAAIAVPFDYQAVCKAAEVTQREVYDSYLAKLEIQIEMAQAEIKDVTEVKLHTVNFPFIADAIRKILLSMCDDRYEPRKYLTGGLLQLDSDPAWFVSTDSHRMTYCLRDIGYVFEKGICPIVCKASLAFLTGKGEGGAFQVKGKKWSDPLQVKIGIDRKRLIVVADKIVFVSALIDVDYPDYQAVIPKTYNYSITCDKSELQDAIKRVKVSCDSGVPGIRLLFKRDSRGLHILGEDYETGESHEIVAAKIKEIKGRLSSQIEEINKTIIIETQDGQEPNASEEESQEEVNLRTVPEFRPEDFRDCMEVDYDSRYVLDALSCLDDDYVWMQFLERTSSVVIKDSKDSKDGIIVMPIS